MDISDTSNERQKCHEPVPSGGVLERRRSNFYRSSARGKICEWAYWQSLPGAVSGKSRVRANALPKGEAFDFTQPLQCWYQMEKLGIQQR